VVVSLVATSFDDSAGRVLRSSAPRVDTRLRALLGPVCPNPDDPGAGPGTNPYAAGGDWSFRTRAADLTGPPDAVADPVPAATEPAVVLPQARAHPELAPPLLPPSSQWLDTNGDGIPDTPSPMDTAARGPAPVFVDPVEVPAPAGDQLEAPTPPTAPTPPGTHTIALPVADTDGPGCGWTFAGMLAPRAPGPLVDAAADRARWQGVVDRAAADTAYRLALATWPDRVDRYLADQQAYRRQQAVRNALNHALADQQRATADYDAAVSAYQQALQQPTLTAPTPTGSTAPTSPTAPSPAVTSGGAP
jgi:hypothetical protein